MPLFSLLPPPLTAAGGLHDFLLDSSREGGRPLDGWEEKEAKSIVLHLPKQGVMPTAPHGKREKKVHYESITAGGDGGFGKKADCVFLANPAG